MRGVLNIGRLGAGRGEYYLAQVASGREDYYLGGGEPPGVWLGSADAAVGVAGSVEADALRAVLAGRSPAGMALAGAARRVPGFDLTFRAPKSVSLLFGLGPVRVSAAVRAGHEAAVASGVAYLEDQACWTRRGARGARLVRGEGFVAAGFLHRTSRAGDPLLHTHVLIANAVLAEGRWSALDARFLYREARAAQDVYHAVLRAELTRRLGVEWAPVRFGTADVAGFTRTMINAFSTRRREILEALAECGERSEAAAQVATLATRTAKADTPYGELVARWRRTAAEVGLTGRVLAGVLGRADTRDVNQPTVDQEMLLGPVGLTMQRSTFRRRDIVRAWCRALPHGADLHVIDQLTRRTLASPELVLLTSSTLEADFARTVGDAHRVGSPDPLYTTRELAAVEAALCNTAARRINADVASVAGAVARAAIGARPSLSDEQQAMIQQLLTSGSGVEVVLGKAGAGKTIALDAARAAWQASGITVLGCSLAARTAAQLESDAGIPATTIARLQHELRHRALPHNSVVVVDEGAMVGTRTLHHLAQLAEAANAKLVLVGDDRQLPAIAAGGGFRALTQTIQPIRLTTNRRQVDAWERAALDAVADGHTGAALGAYRRHGRITLGDNADQLRQKLVADWHTARQTGTDARMLALHHDDVEDLNRRARHTLIRNRELPDGGLDIGGRTFAVGDLVVGRRNDYRTGILNGTLATVVATQPTAGTLTIRTPEGTTLTLSRSYLQRGHLYHAYALTIHKAQGATYDTAYILGDDRLYREAGYVALSRARNHTHLYATANTHDEHHTHQHQPPETRLAHTLHTSRAESSIHELSTSD
jgi:conjugative relaxase-like TrwC/TraI family protein